MPRSLQPAGGGPLQYLVWEPFQDPSDKGIKAIVAEKYMVAAAPGGARPAVTHMCTVTDTQGTSCSQVPPARRCYGVRRSTRKLCNPPCHVPNCQAGLLAATPGCTHRCCMCVCVRQSAFGQELSMPHAL